LNGGEIEYKLTKYLMDKFGYDDLKSEDEIYRKKVFDESHL